jgi:PucR C-terminal helix-turn-helix domain/GGDEF-like domain
VGTVITPVRGRRAPASPSNNSHTNNGHSNSNGRGHNGRVVSPHQTRVDLVERLRARRSEIEQEIFAAACGVSDLARAQDAEYVVGLRAAVAAAVDFVLEGIELGEDRAGPVPSAVVAQAQRAARTGVDLETALLACAAGQRLLARHVIAQAHDLPSGTLGQALDLQGLLVERLMAEISIEHKRELARARRSPDQRHAELVRRLLAGELIDTAKLGYNLEAWHIGLIASGVGALQALRGIAASADRQLLSVSHGEDTAWAWLGGKRRLEVFDLERLIPAEHGQGVCLAIGEPGGGLEGWRLSHQQAQAARLVALHKPRPCTRYAEDMLLAATLRDETLSQSLKQTFLSPLTSQRDGGATSLQTLREYLAAGCNASKAAIALTVTRHTVENRLNTAQEHLGRNLDSCLVELKLALRLEELESADEQQPPPDLPAK